MVPREPIDDFLAFGVHAFTTVRATGSFNTLTREPAGDVMRRWYALRDGLLAWGPRLATARQVHGNAIAIHDTGWSGWLRVDHADGHFAHTRGTGMAVTVADCVPVFIGHPCGATALLHAGWRGTVARILEHGIAVFRARGLAPRELRLHLGPAICGRCYEVSPDVHAQLTGRTVGRPTAVDLRGILSLQARALGVRDIAASPYCTRCNNDRFFSHRAGDEGRQLGVIMAAEERSAAMP